VTGPPPKTREPNTRDRNAEGRDPALYRWEIAGLIALASVVLAIPLSLVRAARPGPAAALADTESAFVGSDSCRDCHQTLFERWVG